MNASTLSEILSNVSETDGVEATFGGGDYTITIWDDMDGGYAIYFCKAGTDLHHASESADRDGALRLMEEYNADPTAWYPVEIRG